jgi:hypothetical protein
MSISHEMYPYEELPKGDVFRYLVLQPGAGDEPLVCNLSTAPIADTQFEAVSYVWGTSIKDQPIVCENHVMNITHSLAKVLRRIRLVDKPLKVWADSICINQEDLKEKGNQVALMGKIYSSAKRVVIYIGSDDGGQGPALCSLLDEVDTMVQGIWKSNMSWDSFPHPDEDDPLLVDPRWNALYMLLKQDWFDRGWVVQEAALASDGQLLWGQSRFDWQKLMRVYVWLSTRASGVYYSKLFSEVPINSHTHVYLEGHEDFGRVFYSELSWGSSSMLRTLNCAKELDLSNARDRIYAFMDLPRKFEQRVILHPNYEEDIIETYRRFAAEYVQSTGGTELLDYVSHNEESLLNEVPSWVPRWDIVTWSLSPTSMAATVAASRTGILVEPVIVDGKSLRVQGVIIDTVLYASDLMDWNTTTAETILEIWKGVVKTSLDCPYVASSEPRQLDAFLSSLSAGTYDGEVSDWFLAKASFARKAQSDYKAIDDDQSSDDAVGGAENDSTLFVEHIRARTDNRKFVLTERGYMGLAPAVVRETDSCAIVFGCKTPCALRRKDGGQHYMFLGATPLVGKEYVETDDGGINFSDVLGEDGSRDWIEWDVEEQDIYLC